MTLQEILENIRLAFNFVAELSFAEFHSDRRSSYAVVRCLEIISEASRRLPPEIKARHPDIPWIDIAGAGSIYRHQYEGVRDELVWHTVQNDLEPLRVVIENELERLKQ